MLSPTPNPNASQWNIVCVGFSAFGLALAMYIFIFFVSISFALGSVFPVEYGLKYYVFIIHNFIFVGTETD